ncbi:MAG: hypothetical protein RXR20_09795 [Paraburkholderia sp.]|uniref:hypothetical protein n=1 Tax=Burkholderiaceae TaxID=119060 RepID=UPI0010F7FFCA|nr:hypothetical protein [Burkholderia sp. 4M9327F10]
MNAVAERAEAATLALRACRPSCAGCRYRADDRETLEQSIPGLTVFSSGFGASVGASRLCRLHDQLVSPQDACSQFAPLA